MFRPSFATAVVAAGLMLYATSLFAQTGFDQTIDDGAPLTVIRVEILTQGIDVSPNPQNWGRAFEEIGLSCRIRQGTREDVPSINEEIDGEVRRIDVVGILDSGGQLTLPDVSFSMADQVEFRNWFAELERYGVQGNPAGQANWGLDEAQLIELLGHLAQPIQAEVKGVPLVQALDEFPFPEGMEISIAGRETDGASDDSASTSVPLGAFDPTAVVVHEVNGLSLGTGLAILLSEQGLGFRPRRNPDGTVDLDVIPLAGDLNPWPIGWDIGELTPRDEVFPTLFEFFPVDIQNVSFLQTITVISERSEVPIMVDERLCAEREIDLSAIRVTVVEDRSAWGLVIRKVVAQARLTFDYRLDEADTPFIWIYPFVPFTPE